MKDGKSKKSLIRNFCTVFCDLRRFLSESTWKGSYTVEASVILGILFWILGTLLISGFYMHDKEVLQSISCETAVAGSIFARQEERDGAAGHAKNSVTGQRLMGGKNLASSVTTSESQSSSEWNAVCPVPGFAARYLLQNQLNIHKSWTSKVIRAPRWIRTIRGVGELLTGGKE